MYGINILYCESEHTQFNELFKIIIYHIITYLTIRHFDLYHFVSYVNYTLKHITIIFMIL